MNSTILETIEISKQFPGVKALDSVSIPFKEGEIHSIIGENGAGKSTLMKIIAGVEMPTDGYLEIDGNKHIFHNAFEARNLGVSIVFQELSVFNNMTVADNIFFLSQPSNSLGVLQKKSLKEKTKELIDLFGLDIDPFQNVNELSVADRQMVEILRAINQKSKLLILDEPSSSLTPNEIGQLFSILERLKKEGVTILYVSHKLDEVLEISDRISVLRDGKLIDTVNRSDINETDLINMMVGRELKDLYSEKTEFTESDEEVMRVEDINVPGLLKNVSFSMYKGEILGIFGLVGAGRTELALSVMSLMKKSGRVYVEGEEVSNALPEDIIQKGVTYVYEDRKQAGLFQEMSLEDNINAPIISNMQRQFFLNEKGNSDIALNGIKQFNIACHSTKQMVQTLSGGNQQKVMLAMWIATNPRILIVDEPTRGIDVGAKAEIHNLLRKLSSEGTSILMISSEMPEIMTLSDRVLVMREGEVSGILAGKEINENSIIEYAAKTTVK